MTSLKNITNKTTSLLVNSTSDNKQDYYSEDYDLSALNIFLIIVFGALAGFLFISLIKCCIKK
jgi:hypothetical protein